MSQQIVGLRIFAEQENGMLREVSMAAEEKNLLFDVIAKFYQSKFTLSPIEVNVPIFKP